MKIIGKVLAVDVYREIQKKILFLESKKMIPCLVIIKSMDSDAVNNYIYQKVKKGREIGVTVEVLELKTEDFKNVKKLKTTVCNINALPTVHGIIFQKPGNKQIDEKMEKCVDLHKDVDGFLYGSSHKPPVYRGVIKVLESLFNLSGSELISYLKKKKIVLIGKGKTGGGTIISGLTQDGFNMDTLGIIDSKSDIKEITKLIQMADIIISAVGKSNPVDFHLFSKKVILIDIGVHFDDMNKIKGDFDEDDIKEKVSYYTTTPGGIGALTVAYLMDNTVNSAIKSL